MASPQPPYAGPSYYHQPPPPPQGPPHFAYGTHSPNPYQHQQFQHQPYAPPPPHMAPPHMNGMHSPSPRGGGRGMRGGHSYNHHHNQNYQAYAPPIPIASPSSPYPRYASPQYPPSPSYAMQPPYPPTGAWQTPAHQPPPQQQQQQQPLSPMPKQLSMPPPAMSPMPVYQSMSPQIAPAPIQAQTQTYVGTIPNPPRTPIQSENGTSSTVPTPSSPSSHPSSPRPSPKENWAIWSRRPRDPTHAPGIIISPLARPPQSIISKAIELRTPSPSPPPSPVAPDDETISPNPAELVSATATETTTTPACSTAPDTPVVPGSPLSTNTSVSLAPASSSSPERAKPDTESTTVAAPAIEEPAVTSPASTSAVPPTPAKQPPKSWASLLRPAGSSSTAPNGRAPNALPTSSVVGFSIPGADATSAPGGPAVSSTKKSELLALLSGVAGSGSGSSAPSSGGGAPKIRPRGLINTGNMCFANSVLQILVYCPPFYKLFTELGKYLGEGGLGGPVVGKGRETPLVDATVEFLKEFDSVVEVGVEAGGKVESTKSRKGKGKEVDRSGSGQEEGDEFGLDSFIPTKVYDAMKEKKRFDNMRGGHQEDAEEFLGFYLDTLEEELLSVVNSLSPSSNGSATGKDKEVEEREEEEPPEEDGWMEVGRRNRMVVTRTVKTAESPITRIFGGKFRSTLRAPQQKDSVVIEDWRALQLDIQREQIHTIKDALQLISTPSSVQVTSPTRPGVTLEASQQVLIETVPPILVLHMKRFLYDTQVKGVVKIGKQVGFGSELDVGSEVVGGKKGSIKYKLFGVLYHHGLSASGGHYTLDVLHPNRDLTSTSKPREGWIRIDDELVSDVRAEDVFGGVDRDDRCAYLLFYRRIGGVPGTSRT